jgi:hypothetical protein
MLKTKDSYFMLQFLQHILFVAKSTQFRHIFLRKNHIFNVTYLLSWHQNSNTTSFMKYLACDMLHG